MIDLAKLRDDLMHNEREHLIANIETMSDKDLHALARHARLTWSTTIANDVLLQLVNEIHELRAYKATLSPEGAMELAARLQASEADAERWRACCKDCRGECSCS